MWRIDVPTLFLPHILQKLNPFALLYFLKTLRSPNPILIHLSPKVVSCSLVFLFPLAASFTPFWNSQLLFIYISLLFFCTSSPHLFFFVCRPSCLSHIYTSSVKLNTFSLPFPSHLDKTYASTVLSLWLPPCFLLLPTLLYQSSTFFFLMLSTYFLLLLTLLFFSPFSCFLSSIFLLPSPSVSSFITPSPSSPIPQGQFNHYVVGWVMRSTEQIPPDIRKTVEKPVLRVGWVIFLSWTFLSC